MAEAAARWRPLRRHFAPSQLEVPARPTARRVVVAARCVTVCRFVDCQRAKVDLVGDYQPTVYRFQNNEHWMKKALKASSFRMK